MEILQYNTRKTGKTTRLIDLSIQNLFTFGSITIPLHLNIEIENNYIIDNDANTSNSAQNYFVDKLLRRLHNEHFGYFKHEIKNNVLTITVQNLSMPTID